MINVYLYVNIHGILLFYAICGILSWAMEVLWKSMGNMKTRRTKNPENHKKQNKTKNTPKLQTNNDWQPICLQKGHSTDMCVFILKEMIRFCRKHRTPVYVCFLVASKAFDCVNHWKLFNVMIERDCPTFIIRLSMFWYRYQKLCMKWDLSNQWNKARWYFIYQMVQYLY